MSAKTPSPARQYRSGAVARMLGMPVATLRIWERRYGLSSAARSPAGHRLYGAADVQRLALLRQLSEQGHAIGSLAGLDMAALREVARTHAGALRERPAAPSPAPRLNDQALAALAGLSNTVACECPKHLAEILRQLSAFEVYTATCRQRSPEDAALHSYLGEVTAQARQQFEAALARVALHEGLWDAPAPG